MIKFLLAFLFSTNCFAYTGQASIGTLATNPAANAVLVQTSALNSISTNSSPSAEWQIQVTYSCTVAATFEFQVMNGSTPTATIYLLCPAGSTQTLAVPNISFSIAQGYTLRVINANAFTGNAQATIFYAIEALN